MKTFRACVKQTSAAESSLERLQPLAQGCRTKIKTKNPKVLKKCGI